MSAISHRRLSGLRGDVARRRLLGLLGFRLATPITSASNFLRGSPVRGRKPDGTVRSAGRGHSSRLRPALSLAERLDLARVHRRGWGILITACAIMGPYYAGDGIMWLAQLHGGLMLIAMPLFVEAHLRAERLADALAHLNGLIEAAIEHALAPERERAAA